jgi:hypothetical protein
MAIYESDHTRFMRELMSEKPQLAQEQKKGRAMWWDKKLDLDQLKRDAESKVRMQAYVYQNKV